MDQAAKDEQWDHTAALMATIVNSQRVKNPVKADDLNPQKRAKRKRRARQRKEESPLLMFL